MFSLFRISLAFSLLSRSREEYNTSFYWGSPLPCASLVNNASVHIRGTVVSNKQFTVVHRWSKVSSTDCGRCCLLAWTSSSFSLASRSKLGYSLSDTRQIQAVHKYNENKIFKWKQQFSILLHLYNRYAKNAQVRLKIQATKKVQPGSYVDFLNIYYYSFILQAMLKLKTWTENQMF